MVEIKKNEVNRCVAKREKAKVLYEQAAEKFNDHNLLIMKAIQSELRILILFYTFLSNQLYFLAQVFS